MTGIDRGSHWYYERARGSYQDDKARQGTPARQREWAANNPPERKFTKTDLAKYEHAWVGLPYLVCRGAEKNFLAFAEGLEENGEPSSLHRPNLPSPGDILKAKLADAKIPAWQRRLL
jgi:hypothetical protein